MNIAPSRIGRLMLALLPFVLIATIYVVAGLEDRSVTPRTRARALPRRARLGFLGEFVSLGVPPEAFERVEIAALAAEDVDDEVEIIEQDPL